MYQFDINIQTDGAVNAHAHLNRSGIHSWNRAYDYFALISKEMGVRPIEIPRYTEHPQDLKAKTGTVSITLTTKKA